MDQALTEQIASWHEDDEHQRIVDALLAVAPQDRDYDMISSLGRAYNNLDRYGEALEQLSLIAEAGRRDPLWHFRTGYSYYYSKQYEQAVTALSAALELDPQDEHSAMLLEWSRDGLEKERRTAEKRELDRQRKAAGPAREPWAGMDMNELANLWEDSDYAHKEYVSEPPTDELIASVEEELGYKLPASYIALMKVQNGGIPKNTCFPTDQATSWADNHIAITGLMGIGRDLSYSLCGDLGSPFMIEEWGYPDIGVVICDCPSAGHDVVMLDYRHCGRDGEPEVIHVDQESDYEITYLAPDFESFIRGLVNEEVYDTSEADKQEALRRVKEGAFSPLLAELCGNPAVIGEMDGIEDKIRAVCTRITEEKGSFSYHADERSHLMYDVQFWLYTAAYPDTDREKYLEVYTQMIAFGGEFGQGGYAPGFVSDWLDGRIRERKIVNEQGVLRFTDEARREVIRKLEAEAEAAETGQAPQTATGATPTAEAAAGTTAALAEAVAPFILVDQGSGGKSVILTVGSYLTWLFDTRAEEGFEGNGYDWASLAAVFLEERMPELSGVIRFDPEADMFCAYSDDGEAVERFTAAFKAACEDEVLIRGLFSRTELD